jgi:hypothetical protein
MTLLALAGLLACALALLALALRWRVLDDHPVCRRCRFDLFGAPRGSTRCPECGADVSNPRAVRVGNRVRRRGAIAVAVPLLAATLATVTIIGRSALRGRTVESFMPVWMLLRQAEGNDPTAAGEALAEIGSRLDRHQLDASQANEVAERALARQGDPSLPWHPRWAHLIEHVDTVARLTDAQRDRYERQHLAYHLEVHPRLVHGGVLGLRVTSTPRHRTRYRPPTLRMTSVAIGPVEFTPEHWPEEFTTFDYAVSTTSNAVELEIPLTDEQWARLAPGGRYDVRLDLERVDLDATSAQVRSTPLTLVTAAVAEVARPVARRTDPSLRRPVADALTVERLTATQLEQPAGTPTWYVRLGLSARRPPIALAFDVSLRVDGREWSMGVVHFRAGADAVQGCGGIVPSFAADARADVVLRPSQAAARRAPDLTEIWGEEIILANRSVDRIAKNDAPQTRPARAPGGTSPSPSSQP